MSDFSRLMEIAFAADKPKTEAMMGPPPSPAANEAPAMPEHSAHEAERLPEPGRRK